jgi:hypothetical protein
MSHAYISHTKIFIEHRKQRNKDLKKRVSRFEEKSLEHALAYSPDYNPSPSPSKNCAEISINRSPPPRRGKEWHHKGKVLPWLHKFFCFLDSTERKLDSIKNKPLKVLQLVVTWI